MHLYVLLSPMYARAYWVLFVAVLKLETVSSVVCWMLLTHTVTVHNFTAGMSRSFCSAIYQFTLLYDSDLLFELDIPPMWNIVRY